MRYENLIGRKFNKNQINFDCVPLLNCQSIVSSFLQPPSVLRLVRVINMCNMRLENTEMWLSIISEIHCKMT